MVQVGIPYLKFQQNVHSYKVKFAVNVLIVECKLTGAGKSEILQSKLLLGPRLVTSTLANNTPDY